MTLLHSSNSGEDPLEGGRSDMLGRMNNRDEGSKAMTTHNGFCRLRLRGGFSSPLDGLAPLFVVLAILVFAAPASAAARSVRFTLKPNGMHTVVLKHTPNVSLRYVLVNNSAILLGDQVSSTEAYMYGNGVMLRFWQRGSTNYIKAVSLAPNTKRVFISYKKSG